jgi:hypothetical protein
VQGGKQGSGFDFECSASDLRDSAGYTHPMQFLEGQRLQDQEIQRALQEIGLRGREILLSAIYKRVAPFL